MPETKYYQQYEVLRREDGSLWELGRGAMGVTYKAFDPNLCRTVALKVINAAHLENDTAQQRFLREARAAAALRHPNVASVFRLGADQGHWFYVMEFIDGENLETYVAQHGPLPPVEALRLTLQVARALGAAVKERLVHRDLKPANLMLVDQGGEWVVKVIDFGLAKTAAAEGEDSSRLTMRGDFVGTPYFTNPEQIEEAEVDARSDIYSLGATLYFMLTGRPPFSGSAGQVMSQHLYKPLPLGPLASMPGCVTSLVQRMMEKEPARRPQTPRELQETILGCLKEVCGPATAVELAGIPADPGSPGTVLAQRYRLVEAAGESPQGRWFLAQDLRQDDRPVSLLALSREFLSDPDRLTTLEQAVKRVQAAPYPTLRGVYGLETVPEGTFVVEESVTGPALLEVLRRRGAISASEVVKLLQLLAPLADHAAGHGLGYVDFTLTGIQFVIEGNGKEEAGLLRGPLTSEEKLELKVHALDFTFATCRVETWSGTATVVPGAAGGGPRGSYVRLLSLLAYELLGGPRTRVELTGRFTPIATLSEEGNAVLRRGLVDELPSAGELTRHLASSLKVQEPAGPGAETQNVAHEPHPRVAVPAGTGKRPPFGLRRPGHLIPVALGLIIVGISGYAIHRALHHRRSLHPSAQAWSVPVPPSDEGPRDFSPAVPASPAPDAAVSSREDSNPPTASNGQGNDRTAQAVSSPGQVPTATPAPPASPIPTVVLPVVTSTPPPSAAPRPADAQADELGEAKRYLQTNDYASALPLLERAAGAGAVEAMASLALLYANGQGVPQDYAKARDWYQKAADAGNPAAMERLAAMYEQGQGGARDAAKAREWREKAVDAAAGTAPSPGPASTADTSHAAAKRRGSHKPRLAVQQTPKPSLWQRLFGKKETKEGKKTKSAKPKE